MPQAVTAREGTVAGSLRADRPWRAFRGGKWMAAAGPQCAGMPRRGRTAPPSLPDHATLWPPSLGVWARGWAVRSADSSPRGPQGLAIWLILPVVICLSQRLSHACLSISTLYGETANGSLNQLSFI
jgi:hypothetical protein